MRSLYVILAAILYICLFVSKDAGAQQSYFRAPRDQMNNPLMVGLGEPYLFEPTATVTAYGATNRVAIPLTGNDGLRQYRHMFLYNPGSTLIVYVCVGDATGCTRDWFKVRPLQGFIDDFTYFGVGDNKTHIYYRLDSAGSQSFDMRIW